MSDDSSTYIGPFGRILPVPKNTGVHITQPDSSSEAATSAMTASRRLLPLPTRLQFGTDPTMGLTEPTRYGSTSSTRRPLESHKPTLQDTLPSVNQLLTPRSLSSPGSSPYPQPVSVNASTDTRPGHSSPHTAADSHPYDFTLPQYYSRGSTIAISPQPQHIPLDRDMSDACSTIHSMVSPQSYGGPNGYEMLPHVSRNDTSRQSIPSIQTINQPTSYHCSRAPSVSYESPSSSASQSAQSGRDMPSSSKPPRRLVGEEVVPGEGLCYIYSDGTHVKKMIDGETVNAQWGVTKAGKARKRLAEACVACRDKKIKCEPGEPKCVQCEKSGRDCRFQTARIKSQFENHYSPFFGGPGSRQSSSTSRSGSLDSSHMRKRQGSKPRSGKAVSVMKRARQVSPNDNRLRSEAQGTEIIKIRPSAPHGRAYQHSDRIFGTVPWSDCPDRLRQFEWNNDPYEVDSALVLHYMNLYFVHINPATYSIFPEEAFMRWLHSSRTKSTNEKMVIYAMLAMSSLFSTREERGVEGNHFARRAEYAIEKSHGVFTLQLVQSRMLLSLYHSAVGNASLAFDLGGNALRAVAALKLNFEDGISKTDEILEFGLNKHGLIECRRRTYWASFIMDRYNGYSTGHLNFLRKEDTFARLPCLDECFAKQEKTLAPFFDNNIIESSLTHPQECSSLGIMAYLVQVSTVWGDVSEHIYRSAQRLRENYTDRYEALHNDVYIRLEKWRSSLPDHLSFSITNLEQSLERGYAGAYVSLYALYHTSCMMLNRHVRHADLPLDSVTRNISLAIDHAHEFLHIADVLSSKTTDVRAFLSQDQRRQKAKPYCTFSTPFPGYAILTAIDIISAAGSLDYSTFTEKLRIMNNGLKIVTQLSRFWASARDQRKAIMRRIDGLANAIIDCGSRYRAWVMAGPIGIITGVDRDIFYTGWSGGGEERHECEGGLRVLRAQGVNVRNGDVLVVDNGGSRGSSVDRTTSEEDF